ncbi:aa3-type cytochrome c oxidase subunit IV [Sphingomonas mucosissima]|uniref:Cytochrome c oxidase subunit IV bacterial aa3 type domain-containing protein n=1 Tax=Sphingomonas mucosissima TaxID=370959 RepID=A0A245ZTM2_9SPHN|nr:aa3-type cytochrome c oxidase subunit IV [Sphingomonas mucosissima]OWK33081.1 hypothetical protein SPMU_14270 [Sphingomonas mucosissima]
MADHGTTGGDIKTHAATYDRVMGMMKWGTLLCILLAALVIYLIA